MSDDHSQKAAERIVNCLGIEMRDEKHRKVWIGSAGKCIESVYVDLVAEWKSKAADDMLRIANLEVENEQLRDKIESIENSFLSAKKMYNELMNVNESLRARLAKVEEAARRKLGCTSCDIDQSIRTGLCRKCAGDLGAALGGVKNDTQ